MKCSLTLLPVIIAVVENDVSRSLGELDESNCSFIIGQVFKLQSYRLITVTKK